MNKKILLSFVVLTGLLFSGWTSYAQSVVNVDPLTGAGSVVIPIYSLSSGQVSLPVSLTYTGNGVKPKDVEGSAGMGWQLQAGGQISRVVRGLPDDVTKDNAGNQRLGWMSPLDTAANLINGFTVPAQKRRLILVILPLIFLSRMTPNPICFLSVRRVYRVSWCLTGPMASFIPFPTRTW